MKAGFYREFTTEMFQFQDQNSVKILFGDVSKMEKARLTYA